MSQPSSVLSFPKASVDVKRVSILGATGSIGKSTLKVLRAHPGQFQVAALSAMENVSELATLAREFKAELAVIGNKAHYTALKEALIGTNIRIAAGTEGLAEAATLDSDTVVSAIVGAAGLKPTLAAIERGATIALANKECLVMAGSLVQQAVKAHNATLVPVDSEHNALFQIFDSAHPEWIESITLTASGGPFRTWSREQMESVTPAQATRHPNWAMGAKISVDSATLMNKGLEMIEAYHLFPVKPEQIEVLVHPESIVHGLVQYVDGSVLAQLSNPDMCTPIATALAWPKRISAPVKKLNLAELKVLHFETPDTARFPALNLARHAMTQGGTLPAVLNAANEVAVQAFLDGKIGFLDIAKTVEKVLSAAKNHEISSLNNIMLADAEAREKASALIHR